MTVCAWIEFFVAGNPIVIARRADFRQRLAAAQTRNWYQKRNGARRRR
jgi:hypothetical protein